MNKKILVGSIIAVVILILVSFTSVVGYDSVKSTSAINSPLFGIRTKRAIGQGQEDITTDYLGHGEQTNIQFSSRMKKIEQIQKAIGIISKMSDRAFSKIVVRVVLKLKYQEKLDAKETSEALQILNNIMRKPNDIKHYDTNNNPKPETGWYISCDWFPGCNILDIIIKILYTWGDFVGSILQFVTSLFGCYPATSDVVCPPLYSPR
ncbi:MAG: hypothetical protein JSW06_03985 [Thermoplasmatales archaeon]|nr:MAG: hypothetical protein JSW06_03985 [Thermoplasmatales archaeon]